MSVVVDYDVKVSSHDGQKYTINIDGESYDVRGDVSDDGNGRWLIKTSINNDVTSATVVKNKLDLHLFTDVSNSKP